MLGAYVNNRKRPLSQIIIKTPKDSSSLIFKIKRQSKLFLKSILKPKIKHISCESKKICLLDSEDRENLFFDKMQKIQSKTLQYIPFIYDYIKKNSNLFYTMLKQEYNEGCDGILKKISLEFRMSEFKKNSIVFRYGDPSLRYYLIFKGSVDVLFPYNESMLITPKAFIIYLLRLKKYSELEVLSQVFEMNSTLFQFDMKKLELWITLAYNTLVKGKQRELHLRENIDKSQSDSPNEQIHSPKSKYKPTNANNKYIYSNDDDDDFINLNDYAKDYEFLKTIEYELIDVMQGINPKRTSLIGKLSSKKLEVTSNEYISHLIPDSEINENKAKMKEATIIKYYHYKTYSVKNTFGEIAIDSKPDQFNRYSLNRLFTVITREDSHLGFFPKKVYIDFIKQAHDKGKKQKVDTLRSFTIFSKSKKHQLIKNYSSCFNHITVGIGDLIIQELHQFKDNQKVYFIKEGEFELICNKSINEIDLLLTELGHGDVIRDRIRINTKPETEEYFSTVNTRASFCLNVYKPNDIVGLNDCVLNGKYIYSVKCKSKLGVLYEINTNLFQYIVSRDNDIIKRTKDLIERKRSLLVELLLKYRDTQFAFSYLFNKCDEFKTKKRLDLKIFKKDRFLPYIPWISSHTGVKESDIDLSLKNTSHRITLADDRKRRTLIFKRKYYEKMKNMKKNDIKKRHDNERNEFVFENRLFNSASSPRIIECNYKSEQLSFNKKNANIDPLVFDNFNRMFNTSFYYQNLFKKSNQKFNIKLKVQDENKKTIKKTLASFSTSSIRNNKEIQTKRRNNREASMNLLNTKLKLIYNNSRKRLNKKMSI